MKKILATKNWIAAGVVLLCLVVLFAEKIDDALSCLAYYEQCTAIRVQGLSAEQCHARDDSVAYLLDDKICLVKKPEV